MKIRSGYVSNSSSSSFIVDSDISEYTPCIKLTKQQLEYIVDCISRPYPNHRIRNIDLQQDWYLTKELHVASLERKKIFNYNYFLYDMSTEGHFDINDNKIKETLIDDKGNQFIIYQQEIKNEN